MFESKSMEELILEGELTFDGESIALGADMAFGNTGNTDRISGIGEDLSEDPVGSNVHYSVVGDSLYDTPRPEFLLEPDDESEEE